MERSMASFLVPIASALAVLGAAGEASAFNFGEHHDIVVAAVRSLPASDRKALFDLYRATASSRDHLCSPEDLAFAHDRKRTPCISLADLSALAADHSCSPRSLENDVRRTEWAEKVVQRGMETRRQLTQEGAFGTTFSELWRRSDLDLELIDAEYGSRAAANDAHFALARASDSLRVYLFESLEVDRPKLNAVGLYAVFHAAALRHAVEASRTTDPVTKQRHLERAMFVEAFAAHFLEDLFASGHIVGTVGNVATRKGTHDSYGESGLDVRTWRGISYEAHGDAFMKEVDLAHASEAVARGLAQLLHAATGDVDLVDRADGMPLAVAERLIDFDVCRETLMPAGLVPYRMLPVVEEVVVDTPVPARSTSLLPRTRAEIGVFAGVASGVRVIGGGASPDAARVAGGGEFEIAFRFGASLTDVVGPRGDGHLYLEIGRSLGADAFSDSVSGQSSRYYVRRSNKLGLRLPFLLVPGDLIVLAPVLAIASPRTLEAVAITSAYGGLIPWQRPILTRAGELQLMIGRKVDVYLYDRHDAIDDGTGRLVSYRTVSVGTPIIEWRPLRRYAQGSALGLSVRFLVGAEVPFGAVDIATGRETTALESSMYGALALEFWGRQFL